jgi:hypothetical protein
LEEKVAAPVQKTEIMAAGIRCADHTTPLYPQKLALTSPTSGGRSVGVLDSQTTATEFFFFTFVSVDFLPRQSTVEQITSCKGGLIVKQTPK